MCRRSRLHGWATPSGSTAQELDAVLDEAAAAAADSARALDVQLDAGPAGTLGIVVGGERSFLSHVPADAKPPYMVSVGEQEEERSFTFFVHGDHHSEAAWRNTVPVEAARGAAHHFLTTGGL